MQTIRVMPATAIALVALVGLLAQAQAPAPAPPAAPAVPEGPTEAEKFLDIAIIKIRAMDRVAAKIVQSVDMLNQKFKLEGDYYKELGHKVRLKLDLSGLGETKATMLQVSDGNILWDYQKVLSAATYRKRDLAPVFEKLKNPALDQAFRDLVIANMGFGGPEALLMGFRKDGKFNQIEHTQEDGRPVVIIRGTWVNREKLMGEGVPRMSPTANLPPYVPSNVQITLGESDYWPYRVKLYGNAPTLVSLQEDTRPIGQDGRPIGVKRPAPKIKPSEVVLEYTLQPLTTLNASLFTFEAPTDNANPPVDDTEQFVGFIDQAIMVETERKKADAAKQEGETTLKDSLIVPKGESGDRGLGIMPRPATTTPAPASAAKPPL